MSYVCAQNDEQLAVASDIQVRDAVTYLDNKIQYTSTVTAKLIK